MKAGPSWFVSDNLLRGDAKSGIPDDVAREIADCNDLRYERVIAGGVKGVRFWRIELYAKRLNPNPMTWIADAVEVMNRSGSRARCCFNAAPATENSILKGSDDSPSLPYFTNLILHP